MKNKYELEKIIKGIANHKRIVILEIIAKNSDTSLVHIADQTNISFKTVAQHIDKLLLSGLITKRQNGNLVALNISDLGTKCLKCLKTL